MASKLRKQVNKMCRVIQLRHKPHLSVRDKREHNEVVTDICRKEGINPADTRIQKFYLK